MASTVQAPPPAPPLRPRPPRSLAGPVVLIVIGIFFLLRSMGLLPWYHWGRWFAHYWPVLLILWGIIKLFEYHQANRAGMRAPGIGAGGIILIVFLVMAGMIASEMTRVNWEELRDQMHVEGDAPWWGHTYTYSDSLEQNFPSGDNLRVTSRRGAINITSSTDDQLHVTVHKRINAEDKSDADKWNGSTRPQISASGQVVTIDANTGGAGDHWVSSDLDISLPRKAAVSVSTRHGDISIMGRDGNAEVNSQNGDVAVTDLVGSLAMNLEHSSARVSQVSSDVAVRGRANEVSLEDVKGRVAFDGDFMESVKLVRIAKPVNFKSSRTEMDFTSLGGSLNLDSGDLEATGITGPLRLRTRSKDISLNGVTNDIHLANENGAVEVHVNKLGSMEVTNRKGDIRIFVPQRSGFEVDAQARDGEIQSDFSQLKIDNGDDRSSAAGPINGGGPRMLLNNEHGTIEIRVGSIVPTPPAAPRTPNLPNPPTPPEPTEN